MDQAAWAALSEEYRALPVTLADPRLDALQVAIYVEDALGITLPPQALNWERLGTWEDLGRVLEKIPKVG